jgi:hypothetical protein
MAQPPVFSEAQEYWLLLEKERYGVTQRQPEVVEKVLPCSRKHFDRCSRPHASESRDQMLFNAGRFAAGARDKVAALAHEKLMKELSE